MTRIAFTLTATAPSSQARAGRVDTPHGPVETPAFMPVGTQATVKGHTADTLRAAGSRMLLANTYHLLLRPGPEVFRRFGGIHRFMAWDGPVLTDSGGFQIFSLPGARTMGEEGAAFRSYVDGAPHLLSPESSIAMQQAIGSDIMMVLDQCIPATAGHAEAAAAMHLTHRWAERSLRARGDGPQALFGIVQGACHADLRRESADFLTRLPFDGFAIGGLAVGETARERYEMAGLVASRLPADRPRYLMGVGTPADLLACVDRGVDLFDCIIPTQLAQRGTAYTSHGKLHLRRSVYKLSEEPLDARCTCATCTTHARGYLHHLVKADELLGWHLLAVHNVSFYHQLMRAMRAQILAGTFAEYARKRAPELLLTDEDNPSVHPRPARPYVPRRCGDYEVWINPQGIPSVRQVSSGEVMHSVNAPEEEARRLYVEQSGLAGRLRCTPGGEGAGTRTGADVSAGESASVDTSAAAELTPLVIWDVGLGAAYNAMSAVRCWEAVAQAQPQPDTQLQAATGAPVATRRLHLVSFERDLDPLRLVTREAARFTHVRHAAPHAVLARQQWTHGSGRLTWELRLGDFPATSEDAPQPDLIFYDPFSAKTDTPLWTAELFTALHARCVGPGGRAVELYTYSAATAVRVALLVAGFYVADGVGTGPKTATTVAFGTAEAAARHPRRLSLLGAEWLARWRRSTAQTPAGLSEEARAAFCARVEGHPQFSHAGGRVLGG